MKLGVCYYPEHWPEAMWAEDAKRMAEIGISQVRIGEFAWTRIEPTPGVFEWGWLDRAIETLHQAGLHIVLGTPTATPPKWLIDAHPDILALDAHGRPRHFGSRRHYCFSSLTYRAQCARIVEALARRYGTHPGIASWQTDNEYGCHDTIISYSNAARAGFRAWLAAKYPSIQALNQAWGNVFWSMEYLSFDEIDPPVETVTEANPAHRQDWARFASDEVAAFDRVQTEILRAHSPGRDVLHNYMGMFTAFDHFKLGEQLDVAAWDSYPLGFLEQAWWPDAIKERFLRQGHPDFTAFHHDLYRGVGRGRWQVIEQQPGPVNWAPWNPAPLPGMVRVWTWEALAHGAECVSYFRWRQAPFAQEQMHAGLLRSDSVEAEAAGEARQVAAELAAVAGATTTKAPVALLFDYEAIWANQIQPQGRDYRGLELLIHFYSAARRLGLSVDIVHPSSDLTGYQLILCPLQIFWPEDLNARIKASGAVCVLGPRAGSKTDDFQIPANLAPGLAQGLIPLVVNRVESLRPGHVEQAGQFKVTRWLEHIQSELVPEASTASGHGIWYHTDKVDYLACWPDTELLDAVLRRRCEQLGLATFSLPDGLRLRQRGAFMFAINYEAEPVRLSDHMVDAEKFDYVIGGPDLPAAGVAAWRIK
ncbi:MAG: beta-galactosidase [Hyphomonadaceae bacterium]